MTTCWVIPDRRCGYMDVRSYLPGLGIVTGNPSPDDLAYMFATYMRELGHSEPCRFDGVTIFGGCRVVAVSGYAGPKVPGVVTYFSSVDLRTHEGNDCAEV